MKRIFTEKTIVVLLFLTVVVTFSLAQKDTRHLESYPSATMPATSHPNDLMSQHQWQVKITSTSGVQ